MGASIARQEGGAMSYLPALDLLENFFKRYVVYPDER
jgi:hypothetical protein